MLQIRKKASKFSSTVLSTLCPPSKNTTECEALNFCIGTDLQVSEMLAGSNARQHEKLCRANGTSSNNHLLVCLHCLRCTAITGEYHAYCSSPFKHYLQQIYICCALAYNNDWERCFHTILPTSTGWPLPIIVKFPGIFPDSFAPLLSMLHYTYEVHAIVTSISMLSEKKCSKWFDK